MQFNDFIQNKFLWVPISIWAIIQVWKFLWELIKTRKINWKRLLGSGGMPSSHSAVVTSLTTMIGYDQGFASPMFALSLIFSLVVMYDATGIRRAAGKQARILNQIANSKDLTDIDIHEKLVELLGHTPFEVFIGALLGIAYALAIMI